MSRDGRIGVGIIGAGEIAGAHIRGYLQAAEHALANHGWQVLGQQPSPILGARGAVEIFLHGSLTRHLSM